MRRGFLMGVVAIVGTGMLPQGSASQTAIQAFPIFVPIQLGPPISFRGCVYYEHAPWGGKWRSISGGTRRSYVGDSWNELISAFSCNAACHVVAFQDRDFQGARGEFATINYVGDAWNDKISSMIAVCKHPF